MEGGGAQRVMLAHGLYSSVPSQCISPHNAFIMDVKRSYRTGKWVTINYNEQISSVCFVKI